MDQVKKAFRGLFKKKPKKTEAAPTATSEVASPAQAAPSTTTPAAPAPATVPEPDKVESTQAKADAAPVPAAEPPKPAVLPVAGEPKKDEAAALTEVRKATESRSTSHSTHHSQQHKDSECWDGSRRRLKVAMDNQWDGPV